MGYILKTMLAHSSNYKSNRRRSIKNIKYIVLHYTGNDGDSGEANAKYYSGPDRGASAHYFVDDDSVTISVPEDYTAWHCGGYVYNDIAKTGGATLNKVCTNNNSIGIEMCDNKRDGKYALTDKTKANVIELVRQLMKKYDIGIDNVVRHFDVTGKYCPRYFCPPYGDNAEWIKFKQELVGDVTNDTKEPTNVDKNTSNVFTVKVTDDALNIRKEPTVSSSITGVIRDNGIYTIVDTKGNWGKLKSGAGWINLKYADKISTASADKDTSKVFKVKVTSNALNIRKTPKVDNNITGVIRDKGVYTIVDTEGTWGKLKSGAGWINLNYTKKI